MDGEINPIKYPLLGLEQIYNRLSEVADYDRTNTEKGLNKFCQKIAEIDQVAPGEEKGFIDFFKRYLLTKKLIELREADTISNCPFVDYSDELIENNLEKILKDVGHERCFYELYEVYRSLTELENE